MAKPNPKPNHKMTDEIRAFIIQALACFDTPTAVAEQVKTEFDVVLPRQTVEGYDPTKRAGRNLQRKWKEMFEAARKNFREDIGAIPIANRSYRLKALQRMAQKSEEIGHRVLAAQIHEQAAKECGDVYTNKQKHEHSLPDYEAGLQRIAQMAVPKPK